ncbi:hypothetical protein QQ045_032537 [Rhodiola kirilowii]
MSSYTLSFIMLMLVLSGGVVAAREVAAGPGGAGVVVKVAAGPGGGVVKKVAAGHGAGHVVKFSSVAAECSEDFDCFGFCDGCTDAVCTADGICECLGCGK